jgi:hypothetical protein
VRCGAPDAFSAAVDGKCGEHAHCVPCIVDKNSHASAPLKNAINPERSETSPSLRNSRKVESG